MMFRVMLVVAAAMFAAALLMRSQGQSGVLGFGLEDNFDIVAPLPDSEAAREILPREWVGEINITRHSETLYVVGGVYVADKGYALHNPASDGYADLDTEQTALLQRQGVLPDPMPKGEISPLTWAAGSSLWIAIAVIGPLAGLRYVQRMRKTLSGS